MPSQIDWAALVVQAMKAERRPGNEARKKLFIFQS